MIFIDFHRILYTVFKDKDNKPIKHPAVFPIELPKRHILSWTNEGDIVLDPFMGSGTTALAAIELNRHYIGIEMNEDYVNIANTLIEEKNKVIPKT